MRRALVCALLALGGLLPAQNLLKWNGWRVLPPLAHTVLSLTQQDITFRPWGSHAASFDQPVTIREAGLYQFHFVGSDCSAGDCFNGNWTVGTKRFASSGTMFWEQQLGIPVHLTAGTHFITFRCNGCITPQACHGNYIQFRQPVLRKVESPAIEVWMGYRPGRDGGIFHYGFQAGAHLLVASVRRLSTPLVLGGFKHGLELDLASPHLVLAFAPTASVQFRDSGVGGPPGGFFLQAVRLGADPAFGSRVYVTPLPWR